MKKILAVIVPLIALAGCSAATGTSAPASSPSASAPATASAQPSLPIVLTASGYIDYPQTGADCKTGNALKAGDPITLVDPAGKTVETGKVTAGSPITGPDGSKRCQSGFGFSIVSPVAEGKYTLKVADKTKELSAHQMLDAVTWSL